MILGDNTYYVGSSTDCPQPCHPLSYYVNNTAAYFTNNATFIFMKGEHLLHHTGLIRVFLYHVGSLTLTGERDYSNTDIIIRCSSNTRGLEFYDIHIINIYGITVTGCGQKNVPPLSFINIAIINIHSSLVHGNIEQGLYISSSTGTHSTITIASSTVTNNSNSIGGELSISTSTPRNIIQIIDSKVAHNYNGLIISSGTGTYNNITIANSVFSHNNDTGLYIYCGTDTHTNITITDSTFTGNTNGGLNIYSDTGAYNIIAIINSSFNKNNESGLDMYLDTDTHNSLIITNSTFNQNAVPSYGGGLYVTCYKNTHDDVTISDSKFNNNKVGETGGGMLLYSDANKHNYISITTSVFSNNYFIKGGGLYINHYKYINQTIINCTFANNVGVNGGGLYIYNTQYSQKYIIYSIMIVTGSTFINNTITQTGGGLYTCISQYSNIYNIYSTVIVTGSAFVNNTITQTGGGLYILSFYNAIPNLVITNNTFTNNHITNDGGGLNIYYQHGFTGTVSYITITYCIFTDNTAKKGGGSHIHNSYSYTHITIAHSKFSKNNPEGLLMRNDDNKGFNDIITKSIFTNNDGSGLKLFTDSFKIIHLSQIIVSNNRGTGIDTVGDCRVIFTEGHSIIANNSSPGDGGGMYLDQESHLSTNNTGHVSFINNTAKRYGGAIYSLANNYNMFVRNDYYYTGRCTVDYLSASFINNSAARAGDTLYGGIFIGCLILFSPHMVKFNISNILQCPTVSGNITNPTSMHPLSTVSSDPLVVCPCVDGTIDCTIRSLDKEVYPGQILHVPLVTVGLCGGVSPASVTLKNMDKVNLISSTTSDHTSASCTTLNYTVELTKQSDDTDITIDVADGELHNSIGSINIHLTILPCPLGLVLDFTSGKCVCDDDIIAHLSQVVCNVSLMPYPIQRYGNNWISQYNKHNCTIVHTGCPFDYCNVSHVMLSLSDSDVQCNYNRSGALCGQCIQGLSLMIGSNRCANCTDTTLVSLSIFIIAAVAGIVLVIFLIVLNLTVSVGTINGVLFYVNVVKLNESVFFSQGNIPVISQFISWFNLDLGIEYCFIDGLDGYIKTWLQFAFPLYVWILVMLFIVACRYSGRLSRLTGHNAVPVLATLILVSYTKLLRTVTNAFMMNTLQCGDYKWNVWNIDGNITYLSVKHTVLFTVSLLFLIAGLVYTGLVSFSQWLQCYSGKFWKSTKDPIVQLKPLIDAYTGPFKDQYRFWTGLCLISRLLLTVAFSFTTVLKSQLLNNYIIIVIVGAMCMFTVGGRIYKDKRFTALETLSLVNLLCLCQMVNLFTTESYQDIVSIDVIVAVSVGIEMLLFVIILIVHCCIAFKKCVS